MDVVMRVRLGYSDSQRYFGKFNVEGKAMIRNADKIAKYTYGMVFFVSANAWIDAFYKVIDGNERHDAQLTYSSSESYKIYREIEDRMKKLAKEKIIREGKLEVEFDVDEIFDDELKQQIAEVVMGELRGEENQNV